jgi:Tol biopolymer transport system component
MAHHWRAPLAVALAALAAPAIAPATTAGDPQRVSVNDRGIQGNADSWGVSMTPDGRYVAFASEATNLVPTKRRRQEGESALAISAVYVHDRKRHRTVRAAPQVNLDSPTAISADGRYVAFMRKTSKIYVRDRRTGRSVRATVGSNGKKQDLFAGMPFAMSANGRYVAFPSLDHDAPNRVGADGHQARWFGADDSGALSSDGQLVAFTNQSALVDVDTNNLRDVFVTRPFDRDAP